MKRVREKEKKKKKGVALYGAKQTLISNECSLKDCT